MAALLLPLQCHVILLADRGVADTPRMAHLKRLNGHGRLRLNSNFWIDRDGHRPCKTRHLSLALGEARGWHHVSMTKVRYGPVPLALARRQDGKEAWFVVSDEPTALQTFEESGVRFDIAENCLDDTSNGCQLEASLIRSAQALERPGLVLALTTRYLVSTGTAVVKHGQRRWGDPHGFRGQSYLKIGWKWVERALSRGYKLVTRL